MKFNKNTYALIMAVAIIALAMVVGIPNNTQHIPHANESASSSCDVPVGARIVAQYDDNNRRHSVYYVLNDRLYCLDTERSSTLEIIMADQYDGIDTIFPNPQRTRLFIVLNCQHFAYNPITDRKQLWMVNTYNNSYRKLAEGFDISYNDTCISIKKGDHCLNSNARKALRRWIAKDHYIDYNGKAMWCSAPYEMMEP